MYGGTKILLHRRLLLQFLRRYGMLTGDVPGEAPEA